MIVALERPRSTAREALTAGLCGQTLAGLREDPGALPTQD